MFVFKNEFKAEKFFANAKHPLAKMYCEELENNYREFKGTPIEASGFSLFKLFEETGSREEYQGVYYKQRRRLLTFILKVWLEMKQEDIYELEDILWAICDEYSWAIPAHLSDCGRKSRPYAVDLFAAETAQAIAEAYEKKYAKIKKAERTANLSESGLLIKDEFIFDGNSNTVNERLITHFEVQKNDEKSVNIIDNGKVIGTVEFYTDGKITILHDKYNTPGRNSKVQRCSIIDFEFFSDLSRCEICYIVK